MTSIRLINSVLFLITTVALTSCVMPQRFVQLNSIPVGAHIYLVDKSGAESKLGETPLNLSTAQVASLPQSFVGFRFEKEGFEVERVFIDLPSRNLFGEINVNLRNSTDWTQAFVDKKAAKYLDDVAKMTAEIQGALASKDLSTAEARGRAFVARYPNLAVGWSLLGNALFLQGKKPEALDSYTKAIGIDPTNRDTQNLIERMKGL